MCSDLLAIYFCNPLAMLYLGVSRESRVIEKQQESLPFGLLFCYILLVISSDNWIYILYLIYYVCVKS